LLLQRQVQQFPRFFNPLIVQIALVVVRSKHIGVERTGIIQGKALDIAPVSREWELLPAVGIGRKDAMLRQGLVGLCEGEVARFHKWMDLRKARVGHLIGGNSIVGIEGLNPGTIQKVVICSRICDHWHGLKHWPNRIPCRILVIVLVIRAILRHVCQDGL